MKGHRKNPRLFFCSQHRNLYKCLNRHKGTGMKPRSIAELTVNFQYTSLITCLVITGP